MAVLGIIPTRMGTSHLLCFNVYLFQDHPHAYGDKKYYCVGRNYREGSSPRVWGQDTDMAFNFNSLGIIPTRMGTSLQQLVIARQSWDHPHAYGDKCTSFRELLSDLGSSPRVWGQEASKLKTGLLLRIIPTRMGTRY